MGESFWLNDYFETNIHDSLHQDEFSIGEQHFILYHVKMPEGATTHELHFCANKREVKSFKLNRILSNLQGRIQDGTETGFCYVGFLTSKYLDSAVNPSRTNFEFEENGQIDLADNLSEKGILDTAGKFISSYLCDYLEEISKKRRSVFRIM